MRTFLYDYLQDPSQAIADACQRASRKFRNFNCPEDKIYAELSSPEFRLYEEIISEPAHTERPVFKVGLVSEAY